MRFLFTVHPPHGHLNPVVPLALTLQERGHELRVATSASFLGQVAATGLTGVAAGRDWPESDAAATLPGVLDAGLAGQCRAFAELGPAFLEDLVADPWRPDVVVRETVEFAGGVRRARRRPLRHPRHHAPAAARPARALGGRRAARAVGRRRAGLRARAGPQPLPAQLGARGGGAARARAVLRARRRAGRRGRARLVAGARPRRPLVYATLGTAFNAAHVVFERLVEVARGARFDLLVALGDKGDPTAFPPADDVRIERYVDQEAVLRHADAVACHGGMGTVMGTLRHGLPLCCIPLSADQPLNALRCEALGCGPSCTTYTPADGVPVPHARPQDVRAEVLREHIDALLDDPRHREAARRLADEIRGLPGLVEEADLLEAEAPAGR